MIAWALLALAMVVLSYLLILALAAACVLAPAMLLTGNGSDVVLLFLCGVAMAGALLWSLVPRREKFEAPGPLLRREDHPRLFEELEQIAAALGQPMPADVYLIPQVNAFVSDLGGVSQFGSRRILGIGLPLIAVMTVAQLRAILAHEFGHYYSGDTRLGPWIYKGRMAMSRSFRNLAPLARYIPFVFARLALRMVLWLLEKYWNLFFRATQFISRQQEYRADELAAAVAGSGALVEGLRRVHEASAAYPAYWNVEVARLLKEGYRPALGEGFARFLQAPVIATQVRETVANELAEGRTQAWDSHPLLRDRIAAAERIALPSGMPQSSEPAASLLGDLAAEEIRLLERFRLPSHPADLKPFAWDDLATIRVQVWKDTVRDHARQLGDINADDLPDAVLRVAAIGAAMPDPRGMLLTPEQRTERARDLLGVALSLAIVEAGGELHASPGQHYFQCGNERLSPRDLVQQLAAGEITREEWLRRCDELKIRGARLAGVTETGAAVE